MTSAQYAIGDQIYFIHPEESWVTGVVKDIKTKMTHGGTVAETYYTCEADRIQCPSSKPVEPMTISQLKEAQLHPIVNVSKNDEGQVFDDLLELSYLHDSTLLAQVRSRYWQNTIYTYIGPIVLALNPFDYKLPNYVDSNMPKYLNEGDNVVRQRSANIPHAWSTAHYSYWLTRTDKENQSVIVSGESGAGKTETAKIVTKYLGIVSTMQAAGEEKEQALQVTKKVNMTSPILEAFGNAKTIRNDNSSRFGKFMKVHFTMQTGVMCGANIEVYLLEKSRICTHAIGERSYHSFYQMHAGSSSEMKSKFGLLPVDNYPSMSKGQSVVIPGMDDAQDYQIVSDAFQTMGNLPLQEQEGIWGVVGSVLHLLNLDFYAKNEDESGLAPKSAGKHQDIFQSLESLLGVDVKKLVQECFSTLTTLHGGETFTRKLRLSQANDTRDALAKSLYERLFLYLVEKINDAVNCDSSVVSPTLGASSSSATHWIGLLDIFGFEHFQSNSFEQLCINLANETLQNHYNTIIFTRDMEECKAESINVESVKFYDNQPCLDLICGYNFSALSGAGRAIADSIHQSPTSSPRPTTSQFSIFAMLDEESVLGKGSDLAFCEKLSEKHGGKSGHPNFDKPKTDPDVFIIKHYAADVKYDVNGFREKNLDTMKESLRELMRGSSSALVQRLYALQPSEASTITSGHHHGPKTVASLFKNQLISLMMELNATHPHWVRCVKPHPAKQRRMFSGDQVMAQMCSAGVLETVRIRKMSFSMRFTFSDFWQHFKPLLHCQSIGTDKENAKALLKDADIDKPELAQIGITKVFLKTEAYHVISKNLYTFKNNCSTRIISFIQGYKSGYFTKCKKLNFQVKQITACLYFRPSHAIFRQQELKEKERELIEAFREIFLLQSQETKEREKIMNNIEPEDFEEIHEVRKLDFRRVYAIWEEDVKKHYLNRRGQLQVHETSERMKVEQDALETVRWLEDRCLLDTEQDVQRKMVRLSEEESRCLVEKEVEEGRQAILKELARRKKQEILIAISRTEVEEHEKRKVLTKHEDENAQVILRTVRLYVAEDLKRAQCMLDEKIAMKEIGEQKKIQFALVEEAWLFRKEQEHRQRVLELRKVQHSARLQLYAKQEQHLISVLSYLEQDFELAARRECKRRVAEEEKKNHMKALEEEKNAKIRKEKRLEQRRKAQMIWREAKMEEEKLAAEEFEHELEKAARVGEVATIRNYFKDCRQLDSKHSAVPAATTPSTSVSSASKGASVKRGAFSKYGVPPAPLSSSATTSVSVDRSGLVASPSPQHQSMLNNQQINVPPSPPVDLSVRQQGSTLGLIAQLQRVQKQHRGKTLRQQQQKAAEKKVPNLTLTPTEKHQRRKEEVMAKLLITEPALMFASEASPPHHSTSPHRYVNVAMTAAVNSLRESFTSVQQHRATSPSGGKGPRTRSLTPKSQRRGAHPHSNSNLSYFKPKSINPFQSSWCPPDEEHCYLPDGSIISIGEQQENAVEGRKQDEQVMILSDVDQQAGGATGFSKKTQGRSNNAETTTTVTQKIKPLSQSEVVDEMEIPFDDI